MVCLGSVVAVVALVALCRGLMVVAAFDGRVMLCGLLANFVGLCLPGPQHRLYRCQSTWGDTRWPVETAAATGG
jgi:hypothetical protein